ncbi:MAG TPA: hypothetical protein DCF33_16120, partial [Saprospirales bacterium]|nr:hypothetical protein [Saprospirales bacterium]
VSNNHGNAVPKKDNHENLAGFTNGHTYANAVQQITTALAILSRYWTNDFIFSTVDGGRLT